MLGRQCGQDPLRQTEQLVLLSQVFGVPVSIEAVLP